MLGPGLSLALAAALLAAPAQDRETVVETWPDGAKRAEYEVVVGLDGEPVKDGSYRSWYANGEEEARGRYDEGRRTGKWRLWYEDGARRAIGKYADGLRDGEWEAWLPDKSVDADVAGFYAAYRGTSPNGRVVEGEVRDGQPHGEWVARWPSGVLYARGEMRRGLPEGVWTWAWPSGARMAEGGWRAGKRDGEWRFWHPGGAFDPHMGSGVWEDGTRVGDLPGEPAPEAAVAEVAAAELVAPVVSEVEPGLAEHLRALAQRLSELSGQELGIFQAELRVHGRVALPLFLVDLCALDPADPAQAQQAGRLHDSVLRGIVPAPGSRWIRSTDPEAIRQNRLTLRRWLSLYALVREDERFWGLELPLAGKETDFLLEPPLSPRLVTDGLLLRELASRGRGEAPLSGRSGKYDLRFDERGSGGQHARALADALAWLVAHQLPSGAWSSDAFAKVCGRIGKGTCEGPGWGGHDVGTTGLALLALLGDGNTTARGPHQGAVLRGVGWLLGQQDREGAIGSRLGPELVYRHAIATTALAEAAAFSTDERILEGALRGVEFIVRIRNPYGAWRYGVPGNGEADTSVTGWMMAALLAGHEAGLELDGPSVEGTLAFLDEVTDPATGRLGYTQRGQASSRIVGVNEHYVAVGCETLTAVGLFTRLMLVRDPNELTRLDDQVELLTDALPVWNADGDLTDFYYWYYGTLALRQLAPRDEVPWKKWRAALFSLLLDHQRKDGDRRGSWDPVGPWGMVGGRVYSTALAALCLEADYRYRPVVEEE